VNCDPSAPIFASSDIGVVADWRQVCALFLRRFNEVPLLGPQKPTSASCMPEERPLKP
jgi:hypothetical protein